MAIDTKIVMIVCAIILGILGIAFSFLPQELAFYLGWADSNSIVLQIVGALYFSFAMVNWTAKATIMGGIYGKPIAIGNFAHFSIGAITLIKWMLDHPSNLLWILTTLLYSIFAIVFGYILFTHPKLKTKEKTTSIS